MNSLDRAFIRAYARDVDVDSQQSTIETTPPRRRETRADATAQPLVQVSYADGSWYRVEQRIQPETNVPAPHVRYASDSVNEDKIEPGGAKDAPKATASATKGSVLADVDLAALFRPPLFRDVAPRTPAEAAAVAADAIATQVDPLAKASEANRAAAKRSIKPVRSVIPTLDYTLAPPSPPLAPRVPVEDFDAVRLPANLSPANAGTACPTADQSTANDENQCVKLSPEELQEFADQCESWHSVELELASADELGSPEEAHVMVVDRSLDPIEAAAQRERQTLLDAEMDRQREEVLSTLIQQEVIVGDLPSEVTWLDGSEYQPTEEHSAESDHEESLTFSIAATPELTGETATEGPFAASLITVVEEREKSNTACKAPVNAPVDSECIEQPEPVAEKQCVDVEQSVPEPIAEEALAIEPPVVEPKIEEPTVDVPVIEEQVETESVADEQVAEEAVADEPVAEEPIANDAVTQQVEAVEPPIPEETIEPPVAPEAIEPEQIEPEPIVSEANETPAEPAPIKPLSPAWEVDRIVWPAISDDLVNHAGDQFEAAIDKFLATSTTKVVAVSGHDRGEGRTTLAICLARAAAATGTRVALVDADFESPGIARVLSLDTMGGWDATLAGRAPLDEAAIASIEDHLTIVPLESGVSAGVLSERADAIEDVLAQLGATFDLVLLDAGPTTELLAEGSWLRRLEAKPSLLLAHDMRSASELEVQQTIELATASGIDVVGVAQTFAAAEEVA